MLILSSSDFRNDNSRRVIIDNLPKPIEHCRLLFIPNEKATCETIRGEKYYLRMQELGFSRDNIRVFDYYDPDNSKDLDLDILYISGGNTFKTLQRIRNCGFDKEILRYVSSGVTYIGGSAGAHIASRDIAHVSHFDPVPDGMSDFSGLGLFDGILICHYTPDRKNILEHLRNNSKFDVTVLTDDDSIVIK